MNNQYDQAVFVFGSNRAGRHGKGAAAFARKHYGAAPGQGEGMSGNSYAIPTKDAELNTLELADIGLNIDRFKCFARDNPQALFRVTRVGCGLAGYADTEIRALFAGIESPMPLPNNCVPPGVWQEALNPGQMRLIVAGGRDFNDRPRVYDDLDRIRRKHADKRLTIVSGMARGADKLGYEWAVDRGMPVEPFPALWDRYGKAAGFIRNQLMAWYGTHLVAYWDRKSKGTRHMIQTAQQGQLSQWVQHY